MESKRKAMKERARKGVSSSLTLSVPANSHYSAGLDLVTEREGEADVSRRGCVVGECDGEGWEEGLYYYVRCLPLGCRDDRSGLHCYINKMTLLNGTCMT